MMNNLPAEFQWNYPARLENVDQVCSAAEAIFDQYTIPRKDCFAIVLLLREALNNAVIHGCNYDATMTMSCRMTIATREIVIEITDNGTGFNWRKTSLKHVASNSEHGRGMSIFLLYASTIAFNDSGNRVTLTRYLEGDIYARNTNQA
jgi:serine/threonine-protein kinase RsbW